MKNILVIPTIRESCIQDFLDAWRKRGDWADIIVVEDNPKRTFDIPHCQHHYSWEEIKNDLGEDDWIISRRDSAIRSYGFLKAYQMGADYIFTLDDDCYPDPDTDDSFCAAHFSQLSRIPQWTESVFGVRTRGLPYYNKGRMQNVVANMGLWKSVPDWDSVQTLSGNFTKFEVPDRSRIIPKGQYFPFCGMNFCFRSDMAVTSYFPLMGQGVPYRRFDDIWFGIIFKRVADHMNYHISVGVPAINHLRASDAMTNLVKEAPGIKTNELLWQFIDDVDLEGLDSPKQCMAAIGKELHKINTVSHAFTEDEVEYLTKLGDAITVWTGYF